MHKKATSHSCLECSKNQVTCCTLGVPVTIDDIERIVALGYKLEEFVEPGEWEDGELEGNEQWWIDSTIQVDGKKYKIHLKESSDTDDRCLFLRDGQGCILGDKRPHLCKLYPFWVNEIGKLVYDDPGDKFCPINKNILPVKDALALMNETEETVRQHFENIKEDSINNQEKHKEILLKMLKKK